MPLKQGHSFCLELDSDQVVLQSTATQESAGVVVRGTAILRVQEPIKIKAIKLFLDGKQYVDWAEHRMTPHQRHYKETKVIINRSWDLLTPGRKTYHFTKGTYRWPFEVPLPGDLPPSVDYPEAQVYYRLKAVAERPALVANLVDRRRLEVSRVLTPGTASALELTQPVIISNVWANKLNYEISLPSRVFSKGAVIPIGFDLRPSQNHQVKILSVACALKEYVTLKTVNHERTQSRIVRYLRDNHYHQLGKTEYLTLPSRASRDLIVDCECDLIRIFHRLKFSVILSNADGHISELKAALPVMIADIADDDHDEVLPPYPTDSAPADSLTSVSEDSLSPFNLWEGIDLSRVPSYTTALCSPIPLARTDSLPSYDTLAMAQAAQ